MRFFNYNQHEEFPGLAVSCFAASLNVLTPNVSFTVSPVLLAGTIMTSGSVDTYEDGAFLFSALTAGAVSDCCVAVVTGKGMDLDWRTMH